MYTERMMLCLDLHRLRLLLEEEIYFVDPPGLGVVASADYKNPFLSSELAILVFTVKSVKN